jgi:hypothetical protein
MLRRRLDERTSVRKVKEGGITNDLFAFLTNESDALVGILSQGDAGEPTPMRPMKCCDSQPHPSERQKFQHRLLVSRP